MYRALSVFLFLLILAEEGFSSTEPERPYVHFSTAIIAPYQMYGEQGELEGFAIPIIECAMERMEMDYNIDVLPWARAQKNVELGESDAFFVASRNAVRDAYAQQSAPLFSGTRSWFFRRGVSVDPVADEFRDQAMVGTIFGTNMHSLLSQSYANVVTKTTEEDLIALLKIGRLDAVFLTDLMFDHTIDRLDLNPADFVRKEAARKPLGVYFGHQFLAQNSSFLELFNAVLSLCSENQSL